MSSEQKKDYKKMYLQTKRRYQELKQQNGGFWGKAENETVPKSEGGSGTNKSTSSKSEVAQLHEKVLEALKVAHDEEVKEARNSSTVDGSNKTIENLKKELEERNKQLDETEKTIEELTKNTKDLQNKLDVVNLNFNENNNFLKKQIQVLKEALRTDVDGFTDNFEKLAEVTGFINKVENMIYDDEE